MMFEEFEGFEGASPFGGLGLGFDVSRNDIPGKDLN